MDLIGFIGENDLEVYQFNYRKSLVTCSLGLDDGPGAERRK